MLQQLMQERQGHQCLSVSMKKILLILFLLLIPKLSWSYFYNAEDVYQKCISDTDVQFGICVGYIVGVYDVLVNKNIVDHRIKEKKGELYGFKLCDVSKVANNSQLVDIFIDFVKKNPKKRNQSAEGIINNTLIVWLECGTPTTIKYLKEAGY